MVKWPYLLVWSSVVSIITCHRVTESLESEEAQNTTTLYPVTEATTTRNYSGESKEKNSNSQDATSWKIEAAFAESKIPEDFKDAFKDNHTESKEDKSVNCTKEFRPSQPLGIIEDSQESLRVRGALDNFIPMKKPASGFHSSPHGPFKSGLYSSPKDPFRQNDFPYKIESSIFTRAKGDWSSLDSKPTVEAPVRVPAGGLYGSPEAFKDKPGLDGHDDNFGLEFNRDVKDGTVDIKKRINPWKNLLRLVTAFIPVGLIISALTPSVITIENTGDSDKYPPPLFRRSSSSGLGTISEPCRRRLLCELHSERNYVLGQTPRRRGKHCYKLPCEDPEALARTLQWLLSYHQTTNDNRGRGYN